MQHRRRRRATTRLLAAIGFGAVGLLAGAGSALAVTYPDVPQDHRFADAIYSLSEQGVVSGFENGTFGPDALVSRGQFAKILVGGVGAHTDSPDYPTPGSDPTFPDATPQNSVFFDFIEEAGWQDIVKGYQDGTFRPAQAITRAQLCLMVVRAGGDSLAPVTSQPPFTDVAGLGQEEREAIAVAYANGIIVGKTATTFAPDAGATRGHAAQMTFRMIEKLAVPMPALPPDKPKVDHSFLTSYEGPETCEGCHPGSMDEVSSSLHFLMDEEDVPGHQGMEGRY
jgi:hypothetical protein